MSLDSSIDVVLGFQILMSGHCLILCPGLFEQKLRDLSSDLDVGGRDVGTKCGDKISCSCHHFCGRSQV